MKFRKFEWTLLLRILFLLGMLSGIALLLVKQYYMPAAFCIVIMIFQVIDLFRFTNKSNVELQQFVESVHYRDFSRRFDEKNAPLSLQPMRKGFNEINTTFKTISKEKETQYVYLQNILELVDTGILSYEHPSGDVMWMNEPLKKLLAIPYLKTIHSLERRAEALYGEIIAIHPGENKVVSVKDDKAFFKVLLSATAFQTDGKKYKL